MEFTFSLCSQDSFALQCEPNRPPLHGPTTSRFFLQPGRCGAVSWFLLVTWCAHAPLSPRPFQFPMLFAQKGCVLRSDSIFDSSRHHRAAFHHSLAPPHATRAPTLPRTSSSSSPATVIFWVASVISILSITLWVEPHMSGTTS